MKAWKTIREKKLRASILETGEGSSAQPANTKIESSSATQGSLEKIREPRTSVVRTSYGKEIVSEFAKTPADIACGPFWELRWGFGCPLDCSYCYLRGTSRGNMNPRYVPVEYVLDGLDTVFNDDTFNDGNPAIFNSGELADSLMNPTLMEKIADKFEEQRRHKILTLSKFGPRNVEFLVQRPRSQTICAWSINAPEVAKRWERAASPPQKRIEAAKMVSEAGYETKVRIDPMFPIENWKDHYGELLQSLLSEFEPTRIILGSPRGLWKTIVFAQRAGVDMYWTNYFSPVQTGWGKKLPFPNRLEMYQFMYDSLSALGYRKSRISMCKETVSMWKEMGLQYTPFTCNCYSLKDD